MARVLVIACLFVSIVHAGSEEARTFKAQGDGLVQRGMTADAIAAYENAVKADPNWLIASDALAASLFSAGRHADVIARLKPVVDAHPDYANGLYSLGYAYRKTGKNAESVDAYTRYLKLKPEDPEAYYGLGRAQAALGKQPEAMAAYEKYLALEKRPTERRWVEKARGELAEMKKAGVKTAPIADEAGSPGDRTVTAKANSLCDQADAAEKDKKFAQAYELYRQCRTVDASSTRAYDGIGEAGLRLLKFKEMIVLFRGALADNPGYSAGFYYLGRSLRETGKKSEALEAMKRFTSLQPTNPEGQIELGMLLKESGDKDGAVKALKKYLEVENRPGRESARKSASDALKELGAN
jgi:tetratricopeptide (TPR) repeat protein